MERLYATTPPNGFDDFTIYLRHLKNTDAMLGKLHDALTDGSRPGWLCAYGDHVPILPSVYARSGFADGNTDYLIVGSDGKGSGTQLDLEPEALALCLLQEAGLAIKNTNP
jgi:hypothetical protein